MKRLNQTTGLAGRKSGSARVAERTVLLTATFWSCAFLINEAMSFLRDELPFFIAGGHRAAAFVFGALLALASAVLLKRIGLEARKQATFAGATLLLMPALHAVFFFLTCKIAPITGVAPMSFTESVQKGLLSTGYFGAWIALQLALTYHREAQEVRGAARVEDADGMRASNEESPPSSEFERRYLAWCGTQRVCVHPEEIRWVESQKDYVILHCTTRSCIMRMTLSSLAEELPLEDFVRVHRSSIVRRSLIASMHRRSTGALELKTVCGAQLPVGRSYAHTLRTLPQKGSTHVKRTSVA